MRSEMFADAINRKFTCKDDWDSFISENEWIFDPNLLSDMARSIKLGGLIDPVYGFAEGENVRLDTSDYRESLVVSDLNSRCRAALAAATDFRISGSKFLTCAILSDSSSVANAARRLFPISRHISQVEDVNSMQRKSEEFDIVISSDFYNNKVSVAKVALMSLDALRSGGVLIATFPFHYRSYFDLSKSEPNDNESQFPGWEILDLCRASGGSNCAMWALSSARLGVIGSDHLAVFVLIVTKI